MPFSIGKKDEKEFHARPGFELTTKKVRRLTGKKESGTPSALPTEPPKRSQMSTPTESG